MQLENFVGKPPLARRQIGGKTAKIFLAAAKIDCYACYENSHYNIYYDYFKCTSRQMMKN